MKTAHPNIGGWFDWCLLYLVGFEAFLGKICLQLGILDVSGWYVQNRRTQNIPPLDAKWNPPWMPECNKKHRDV